jgi:hypothetical protein
LITKKCSHIRVNQYAVNGFFGPEKAIIDWRWLFHIGEEIVVTALANDCYMFIGSYEDVFL